MKDGITRQANGIDARARKADFDAVHWMSSRLDPGFLEFLAEVDRLGLPLHRRQQRLRL